MPCITLRADERLILPPASTMASSTSDASPYSTLQYLHSWAEPHLPPSINYILSNGLKALASLPPSVANIVPLVIGGFMLYWALMTAYSTVRSTVRQSWFLLKWGTIAVAAAYGWAMIRGEQPMNIQQNPLTSMIGKTPLGGIVNQAAGYAGFNSPFGNSNGNLNLNTDDLMQSAYNNFVPYPLRMMGDWFGVNPGSFKNGRGGSSSRAKTRQQQEAQEKLVDTANVATEWLGGMFGKVQEALQNPEGDRYSESRKRRNR